MPGSRSTETACRTGRRGPYRENQRLPAWNLPPPGRGYRASVFRIISKRALVRRQIRGKSATCSRAQVVVVEVTIMGAEWVSVATTRRCEMPLEDFARSRKDVNHHGPRVRHTSRVTIARRSSAVSSTRTRAWRGSRTPVAGAVRSANPIRRKPAGGVMSTRTAPALRPAAERGARKKTAEARSRSRIDGSAKARCYLRLATSLAQINRFPGAFAYRKGAVRPAQPPKYQKEQINTYRSAPELA